MATATGSMTDIYEEGKEAANEYQNKNRQQWSEMKEKATAKTKESWEDAMDFARRNPEKVLGGVLVVGAAIGVLAATLLRGRERTPQEKVRDLAQSGNDAWKILKNGLDSALSDVKCAFEDAASKLR